MGLYLRDLIKVYALTVNLGSGVLNESPMCCKSLCSFVDGIIRLTSLPKKLFDNSR